MDLKRIALIILIIFLPLFFLLQSTELNTFNRNLYLKSYEKHDAMEITGRTMEELDGITQTILQYLRKGLDEEVLRPFFNEREVNHMKDVKFLFKYGFIFKNISLALSLLVIVIVIISKEYRYFAKGLFYGIFAWWGLFILLFLLATMDFTKYFTYFHLIFFDNDLWLLNPRTDLLIQMLPEQFFIGIFRRIILLFVSILATIQIIAYILMKKERKGNGRTMDFQGLFKRY